MRLKRIFLIALMSAIVAGGCSASRNAVTSLRGRGAKTADEPNRRDHEYSPSPGDGDDGSKDIPREPVPAPPAFGISRVKSVSWLRDLGAKLNRTSEVTETDCADEALIGKCSPILSCTPDSECGEPATKPRFPAANRFRKAAIGLFNKPQPLPYTKECGTASSEQDPCVPNSARRALTRYLGEECGETPPKIRRIKPPLNACGNLDVQDDLHSGGKKECLAEPLIESTMESSTPGLISPTDSPLHEYGDPPIPLRSPFEEVPQVPFVPEQPKPAVEPPASREPSAGFVEPPVWPRLRAAGDMSSVSHGRAIGSVASSAQSDSELPQIIPMQH